MSMTLSARALLYIAIGCTIQFMVLTLLAMYFYPGGTIQQPDWTSYSFANNYFSDLGRTRVFDGASNAVSHFIFKCTLTLVGLGTMAFMLVLPRLFRKPGARIFAFMASFLGLIAGVCYISIGHVPWNEAYGYHRYFVTRGFIAFLGMSIFYILAILTDPRYPKRYAVALAFFAGIAFTQICVMLLGPRPYISQQALLLQAVAQKVTVYAEILCMLYLAHGALRLVEE